jgi:DNA repair exonuclease SbcCD ATPase subunit
MMATDADKERALAAALRRIHAAEDRDTELRAEIKRLDERLQDLLRLRNVAEIIDEHYVFAKDNAERRVNKLGEYAATVESVEGSLTDLTELLNGKDRHRAHRQAEDGISAIKAKIVEVEQSIERKRNETKAINNGMGDLWSAYYSIRRSMDE